MRLAAFLLSTTRFQAARGVPWASEVTVRLLVGALALASALCGDTARAQSPAPRTVLALFSSTEDYPANPVHDAGIREGLLSGSDDAIDYFTERLDSDRFPGEHAPLALRDYLRQKYLGRHIDVVIAVTDTSLRFVLEYRDELFPDAAIVHVGNVDVDADVRLDRRGVTGVVVGGTMGNTLELALTLHPSTKRVFVVGHTPNLPLQESVRTELDQIAPDRITYIDEESIPRLIETMKAVPPNSLILYLRQSRDESGKVLYSSDVARLLAGAAPVPVYGVSDLYLGSGVVGGAVFETRTIGVRLGEMARAILDGRPAWDIPTERANAVSTFDWRQLRRWGISESVLPAGSTILYREPGAWGRYKYQIVGGVLLVVLQSAFITLLLVQRSRRIRIELALRESEERFRLMADTAPVLVWRADPDGQCDFVNRPWLTFTGRLEEQELGSGWTEGIWPDDRSRCRTTFASAYAAQQPFEEEFRLRRADGAFRWLLVTGVPRYGPNGSFAGFIGSGVDITERKTSEDALRESQVRYTVATGAGSVGVWDWNLETNEVYVDPSLKAILGFADAEISTRGDDWGSRVYQDDVPMVTARAQACMAGRLPDYEVEHRMVHKDGSIRWFLSRGSVLRRPDGAPHRMIGTKVDITERKQAEETVREREAMLRVTDREVQHLVGRVIAAQEVERARIARDLHDDTSQQLAGLAIALSNLKRRVSGWQGDDDLQRDVSALQERTISLAENIRSVSHDLHPGVLEHAGLVSVLGGHCRDVERLQGLRVTFHVDGIFDDLNAATALCLYRIAQEALRNVVRHAAARRAEVWLRRTGDCGELTIIDDGQGFDISRAREGAKGLGLISINERVRLAGGTVSISTELTRGTRLRIEVPVHYDLMNIAGSGSGEEVASV